MLIYTFVVLVLALVTALVGWFLLRRRNQLALRWPEGLTEVAFQGRCMQYLAWRGCELTEPTRPTSLVRRHGIVLFTACFTRIPFEFEINIVRYKVSTFRKKQENGGGLIIISCEVPYSTLLDLAGTHVRVINYQELADLDRLFKLEKMPVPEKPPDPPPLMSGDAWSILTGEVPLSSGLPDLQNASKENRKG